MDPKHLLLLWAAQNFFSQLLLLNKICISEKAFHKNHYFLNTEQTAKGLHQSLLRNIQTGYRSNHSHPISYTDKKNLD